MKFSLALVALVAPMVLAMPSAEPDMMVERSESSQPPGAGISGGLAPLTPGENKVKRSPPPGAGISGPGLVPLSPGEDKRSVLEARLTGSISSCKSTWIYNNYRYANGYEYYGYNSAVNQFCEWATTWGPGAKPAVIPPNTKFTARITKWALLTGTTKEANIDFEIHNKRGSSYTIDHDTCIQALDKISAKGGKCYGSKNDDTKGGTWDMSTLTFHAFPSKA